MEKTELPANSLTHRQSQYAPDSLTPMGSTSPRSPAQRIKGKAREASIIVRKPRNLAALAVFGIFVARAAAHQFQQTKQLEEFMAAFDTGHDEHLSSRELATLLRANGMNVSQEQVGGMFGRVDDEGDGFDNEELSRVLKIVADLPLISDRIQKATLASNYFLLDMLLCLGAGVGLYYMVSRADVLEKRWLASSFRAAVKFQIMQGKCGKLDVQLGDLSEDRAKLERAIKEIEANSSADLNQKQEELDKINKQLEKVQAMEAKKHEELQSEVSRWQATAEDSMREATKVKSKMESMMLCMKGLQAFNGVGQQKFEGEGAQQGFSRLGFSMDTIMFGTIENQKLLLFETSKRNKLGAGKDSAYRCKEVETGDEYALKMYSITNPAQRRSIFHDLYAQRAQVGKHPRIVSYERVIESENMIFVLMELLSGKDLFDVVCSQKLTEDQARHLFVQLAEGLKHLHDNQVIHCDIKPENAMVLGSVSDGTARLQLIDFGCSCFEQFEDAADMKACIVYDTYTPPEHVACSTLKPSMATDMYRLGCTLFIMLVQRPPFRNDALTESGREARRKGEFIKGAGYDELSLDAQDLITKLLSGEPIARPTIADVLEHPWVTMRPTA